MTALRLRIPAGLAGLEAALRTERPERGLVFAADPDEPAGFDAVEDELAECFRLTQQAAAARAPIVYVIAQADLLGQRGALRAMRACALLSAMRAVAMEGVRDGLAVNALAVDATPDARRVAEWARLLLSASGVSGELLRVDVPHVGKALP